MVKKITALIIIFCFVYVSCDSRNKTEQTKMQTESTIIETESIVTKADSLQEPPYGQHAVVEFKNILLEETSNRKLNFNTGKPLKSFGDYWELEKHPHLVSTHHYRFINMDEQDMYITVSYYEFKEFIVTTKANHYESKELLTTTEEFIDSLVEKRRDAELSGKLKKFDEKFIEQPYCTFRDENFIFVLNCTPKAKGLLDQVFESFAKKREIRDDNIIPSKKKYISQQTANTLKPIIKEWLDFYKFDINKFYVAPNVGIENIPVSKIALDTNYLQYHGTIETIGIYDPILREYSPNKTFFINVLPSFYAYRGDDGKHYYHGGEDYQVVHLVNTKNKKIAELISWGVAGGVFAAYWKDNETAILVGQDFNISISFYIKIIGENGGYYQYRSHKELPKNTFFETKMKARGFIIDN